MKPPKTGAGGLGERAQLTGAIISSGAKGAGRQFLSKVAYAKKGDACVSTAYCWHDPQPPLAPGTAPVKH